MKSRLGRLGTLRVSPALLMLLLLPLLTVMPAVPIDETRYLSIAWEMRQSGSWITLHLNGLPYVDKPPLLFWTRVSALHIYMSPTPRTIGSSDTRISTRSGSVSRKRIS